LAQAALKIDRIRHWEGELTRLSDDEIKQYGLRLRGRARGGEPLAQLLPEAFGLVCVAAQRTLRIRPFDVQLAAGVVIHNQALAEVATGEGKTLIAALPVFLNALVGKGVHVTTVNDYLARRDAEWTGPLYNAAGLTVGVLQMKLEDPLRQQAYKADITYGMASEFGFDFLRDRLRASMNKGQAAPFWAPWTTQGPYPADGASPGEFKIQRGLHFALVDEADSIFIDEARTPLVIGLPTRAAGNEERVVYEWCDQVARQMQRNQHFILDPKKGNVELTEGGRQLARWSQPPSGPHSRAMDKLFEQLEKSLQAHYRFRRDQHYLVEEDKVVIIDEFTGRRMPDRHWQDGLHQAVEAKEGVTVSCGDGEGGGQGHAAQVTFQRYFKLYKRLAGMSGTAAQNLLEIRRIYKLWVVPVPTNKPVIRKQLPDRVFPTQEAKFKAVVEDVVRLHQEGRPVLIGTRSVDKSEELGRQLTAAGISHQVLNAKQHDLEAQVVQQAGQPSRVTIATNMAGRGTDIKLGPGVAEAGGLHVLGTERHEARRIDRQLAGRAARQGDPGSCQFFLALDDELLEALGPHRQAYWDKFGKAGGMFDWQRLLPLFYRAQAKMERRHRRQRIDLMLYEKQRQEVLKDIGADPYVD
jgi:preprotein translocase subunit SecA